MASNLDFDNYDFTDLPNYPNVGVKDGEFAELSFGGNILIRSHNQKLLLSDEAQKEWDKCSKDFFYFFETYCKIHTQDGGKVLVELRPYQREFIQLIHDNKRIIGLLARQVGKTTVNALYIVWNLCFKKDWVGMVVANEDELKKEIVEMIQTIYENLPPFLQLGVDKWNMSSMTLVGVDSVTGKKYYNKLRSAVAGKNAGRGKTPNFVLSDESAWYDPQKAKAYFDSIKASLSSGENNKFVMVSTPQGYNIFHDYWKKAKTGESDFKPYFANWKCVPGRDESWKSKTIKQDDLTPLEWSQNHECSFIGSSSTLLDADTLSSLSSSTPVVEDYIIEGCKLYKEYNPNRVHLITVDTSKTVGKADADNDYISVNVLEFSNKIEQVATWRSNEYHYKELAELLYNLGEAYDFPYIVIENNEGSGQSTVDKLHDTLEYPNIYFDPNPKLNGEIAGLRTTTNRRQIGLMNIKKLIKNEILIIHDIDTIDEFFTFVKLGKKYQASQGETDDCIMSLSTGLYILEDINNDLEYTIDMYLDDKVNISDEDEESQDVDFIGTINSKINEVPHWMFS